METYKILKFYQDPTKKARVVRRGLTLEEAKAHCSKPTTHGPGWFDGYTHD